MKLERAQVDPGEENDPWWQHYNDSDDWPVPLQLPAAAAGLRCRSERQTRVGPPRACRHLCWSCLPLRAVESPRCPKGRGKAGKCFGGRAGQAAVDPLMLRTSSGSNFTGVWITSKQSGFCKRSQHNITEANWKHSACPAECIKYMQWYWYYYLTLIVKIPDLKHNAN